MTVKTVSFGKSSVINRIIQKKKQKNKKNQDFFSICITENEKIFLINMQSGEKNKFTFALGVFCVQKKIRTNYPDYFARIFFLVNAG